MGLDQYAISSTCDMLTLKGELDIPDPRDDSHHFYSWRKHNRMEGWMESLWVRKYGHGEEKIFNCETVELELQDLRDLQHAILQAKLPQTEGFCFGPDSYEDVDDDMVKHDLEFVRQAKDMITAGKRVWYTSWW